MNGSRSEAVDAPVHHHMSDAAKRRRLRAQLVQEHIAKITQEQKQAQDVTEIPEEILQESPDTRREVVAARGGRMCTIVVDTPSGHSAGRLKLVTGYERLEMDEDEKQQTTHTLAEHDKKRRDTRKVEPKGSSKVSKSRYREDTRSPSTIQPQMSPEDPKKAHYARRKLAGEDLKKHLKGATAQTPALREPPLYQAAAQKEQVDVGHKTRQRRESKKAANRTR